MIDDFDHIDDLMDRLFGRRVSDRQYSLYDKYERMMDEDHIYYTFELRHCNKEDIDIQSFDTYLLMNLNIHGKEYSYRMELPYEIIPKKTKVTFINGILDIITTINKNKSNKVLIE